MRWDLTVPHLLIIFFPAFSFFFCIFFFTLQWNWCTGKWCDSGGRCLWPNLGFIPVRCNHQEQPELGRKLLLYEGLISSGLPNRWMQRLSSSGLAPSSPSLCLMLIMEQKAQVVPSAVPFLPLWLECSCQATLWELGWSWLLRDDCLQTVLYGDMQCISIIFKPLFLYTVCFSLVWGQPCAKQESWAPFLVSKSFRTDAGSLSVPLILWGGGCWSLQENLSSSWVTGGLCF